MSGVCEALAHEQAEQILGEEIGRVQRIDVGPQGRAERGAQIVAVLDRVDPREHRPQRRGAARVDPGLVEIGRIIIGDAALVGARGRMGARGAGDDLAVAAVDHVGEIDERADPRAVAGHLGMGAPGAVGVAVEAVARRDIVVDAGEVDADLALRGGEAGRRRRL